MGELAPMQRRRFVAAEAAVAAFAGAGEGEYERFREDIDAALDQDPEPRA